ncbi:4-hydroxyacetophenone monooxygenase [Rhodococcus sp. 27YEA15]|uniref:flavin-containing monooxygenase n=1 Tax=Rhodococcus sp. 27YEA15 TaxID=3156259 RepID=UPI003C7B4F20
MSKESVGGQQEEGTLCEVATANIPTLLMVIYQVTGDERWLNDPYRPTRSPGLNDHDTGGLPQEIQDEILVAGVAALDHLRAGGAPVIEVPDPELMSRMLGVCVGEKVDENYGRMFSEEFRRRLVGSSNLGKPVAASSNFRVLVVGAGVSGIIAAQQLQEMGVDFLVVDKHDAAGGNWIDNRYPGVGVDTPSHLYSFSFSENDWQMHFELRPQLQDYLERTFAAIGGPERTRFGTDVVSITFDEESAGWYAVLRDSGGVEDRQWFNAVVSAVGILNRPKMPTLPGIEDFQGLAFHSSAWPEDLDIRGRRVAIIGSGASAMQIVPAIVGDVGELTLFQRTPPWVAPFEKFMQPIDGGARRLLSDVPLYRSWYWLKLYWQFGDKVLDSLQKDPTWQHPERAVNARNDGHRQFFTQYIRDELGKDADDLFDKVLPSYPPYGKRILLDNGWYRALCRPHVRLVDKGVAEVKVNGVVDTEGQFHEADILVWATGFEASRFVSSYDVIGRDGLTLRQAWDDDDARAFLGVTVPEFPNFFMLGGPNSFPGSGSFMYFMEVQMRYITRLFDAMAAEGVDAVNVRSDVFDEYNAQVEHAAEQTVWTHPGTNTFFRNERGRLVFVSPFRNVDYWSRAESSGLDDYTRIHARAATEERL